ncbi:MAG: hypothetical protein IPO59_22120 [Betaproteobacteria bacterium]|nr:hypothetical protein [Betaproteobacteria bacterium]
MTDEDAGHREKRWTHHLEEIDLEIAKLATLCKIPAARPGRDRTVLKKDTLVGGTQNPRAFDKLRSLLLMHYSVRDKAVVAMGEAER